MFKNKKKSSPRMACVIVGLALFVMQTVSVQADSLKLKNGTVVMGTIIEKSDDFVEIEIDSGIRLLYYSDEIQSINTSEGGLENTGSSLLKSVDDRYDEISALFEKEEYDMARQKLDQWEKEHPEDKDTVDFLRKMASELEGIVDEEERVQKILELAFTEFDDVMGELKEAVNEFEKMPKVGVKEKLINAVVQGDVDKVKAMLQEGADPNQEAIGLLPLVAAAKDGRQELAEILIQNAADVNIQDWTGSTPLMQAVISNQQEFVKYIINAGADVNAKNKRDQTALNLAQDEGYDEIVKILQNAGGKSSTSIKEWPKKYVPYSSNDVKQNLMDASSDTVEKVIEYLDQGADVNTTNVLGMTPLMVAANAGKSDIVKVLIEKGADVNKIGKFDMSALSNAITAGHVEVVELLLDNGADVNEKTSLGISALTSAAGSGKIKIVRLLLSKGAAIDQLTVASSTALMMAVDYGHVDVVEELVKQGANLNIRTVGGQTALDKAVKLKNQDIVKILVEAGAKSTQ